MQAKLLLLAAAYIGVIFLAVSTYRFHAKVAEYNVPATEGRSLVAGASAAGAKSGATAVKAADGSIPKIIHHMHKNEDALSVTHKLLRARCKELHPTWEFKFWDDEKLDEFVKTKFSWYYDTWISINPLIKRLDSSRYMLMHEYGGLYLDVDVECVQALDGLIDPLPKYAAWTGDFPEPMFVMSAPKNEFWLHALDRIKRVWKDLDAWHATGPAGLNDAFKEWVSLHGSGVLVPYVTKRTEKEFHDYIKGKNNTCPWYMLANGHYGVEDKSVPIWYSKVDRVAHAGEEPRRFPKSNGTVSDHWRVGFVANELLDPVSCSAGALAHCVQQLCKDSWPLSYLVHHCMNTWRGRIGTT